MVYLMFTSLWPLSALYSVWLVMDWHKPERGKEIQVCMKIMTIRKTKYAVYTLIKGLPFKVCNSALKNYDLQYMHVYWLH